jgi:hypothetical protein
VALEGTLRDFSFADILQLISLQRKTGVLTLKNDENVVTISFLEGRLVGSSSLNQHTEDRLGLILLKKGALTETELDASLRRQEETLQRLGRILIDHHVVDGDAVREALQQQILQIVFRVFRWADGDYHFSQETDIDYDRDLMTPMAADSIIMEGARMTDEWPFIDQRIPDREAIFVKVDARRSLEVTEDAPEELDELGFSFTDTPDEGSATPSTEDRVSRSQALVYDLVNGRSSVAEIILASPLIEFDTCKALADLVDRGLIRHATNEEMVRELRREPEARRPRFQLPPLPWLAVPFLVLLGFALTVMPHNPINPGFDLRRLVWERYVLEGASWFRLESLARSAETSYFLTGIYPESVRELQQVTADGIDDPWGRPYRVVTRGQKLMVSGSDGSGQPVPLLIVSRTLAWEDEITSDTSTEGPGVILID